MKSLTRNLLILGAGGHGRVVKETALVTGSFSKVDFLDDHSDSAIGKCEDYIRYRRDVSTCLCSIW